MLLHLPIIKILLAFVPNMLSVDIARPKNVHKQCVNSASTVHQQCVNSVSTVHQQSINRESTIFIIASVIIGGLYYHICFIINILSSFIGSMVYVDITTPKMSVNRPSSDRQQSINRASTVCIISSVVIQELCYGIYP
jgi:hypothetical protein